MLFSTATTARTSGQSFIDEMVRANINLSLVQSQIDLLQAFKSLCVEHCAFFTQDREVQRIMARVVQSCLQSNARPCSDKRFMQIINQVRLDLSLALVRALVLVKAKGSEYVYLLNSAWLSFKSKNPTFDSLVTNEDYLYQRTGLSVILLCLQLHNHKGRHGKAATSDRHRFASQSMLIPTVLEIAAKVVVEGFVDLVSAIHDQSISLSDAPGTMTGKQVGTVDVEILLSILQTVLRLPTVMQIVTQLSSVLSDPKLVQSCLMLYSWSHNLPNATLDHGQTYASLSIQLLVSMSSLPQVAEELAIEGVLQRISACRTTQALRAQVRGVSHWETQPYMKAMYSVWTQGVLPLCLNLLTRVGRTVSAEVVEFLNQFPAQLYRAVNSLTASRSINGSHGGFLTLKLAQEIATSALINRILQDYRGAGASAGVDTSTIAPLTAYDERQKEILDDITELLQDKGKQLKVRLVANDGTGQEGCGLHDRGLLERNTTRQLQTALTCLKDEDMH